MADPISGAVAAIGAAITAASGTVAAATLALTGSAGLAAAAGNVVLGLASWKTALYAAGFAATALLTPSVNIEGSPTEWRADPNAGIPFVMGEAASGGVIVHRDAYGKDNHVQSIVTVYSGAGPIESFDQFYADDVAMTFGANGVATNGGAFADNMWLKTSLGAQPQAAALSQSLNAKGVTAGSFQGWGASSKISGKAHTLLTMRDGQKRPNYPAGEPRALMKMRGVKFYDPRLDSTVAGGSGAHRADNPATFAYSENPAIAALNWCLGLRENGVLVGGIGASLEGVDLPAFIEWANTCEANGWTISAVPTSADDKHQVLLAMMQAGGARYARYRGRISCIVRAPKTSVVTLSSRDTAGPFELDLGADRLTRTNTVLPRCVMESHRWEMVAFDPVTEAAYVSADGGERERGIDYPYVAVKTNGSNRHQPAQLAAYAIVDSREAIAGTVPLKPWGAQIRPGDVFTINEPEFLLDGVELLCLRRELDLVSGLVSITFISETAGKHDYALGLDPTPPVAPGLTAPDLYAIDPPEIGVWSAVAGAGGQPSIIVTGDANDAPNARGFRVEYRTRDNPATGAPWVDPDAAWTVFGEFDLATERVTISGLEPETVYEVAVSYISQYGILGSRRVLGLVETGEQTATSATRIGEIAEEAIQQVIDDSERTAENLIQLTLDAREERIRRKEEAIEAARGVFDEGLVRINAARDRADQRLEDAIGNLATDVTELESTLLDADTGLQGEINKRVLTTTFNTAIGAEQAARAALAGQVNTLITTSASIAYVDGVIASSEGSQALINTSLQSQINALDASAPDLSGYATINYVDSVETSLTAAIAASENTLQAQINGITGGVDITSLASITYVDGVIATLDGSAATARANLEASFNAQLANRPTAGAIAGTYATISQVNQVSADADAALASAENRLDARIDGVIAGVLDLSAYATITYTDNAIATAEGAAATARNTLRTEMIGLIDGKADTTTLNTYAQIVTLNQTRSDLEGSIAQLRTDMEAAVNALDPTGELPNLAAYATISYVDTTKATLDAAIAASATTLTANFQTGLDNKADSTELTDGLATKAEITYVDTAIANSEQAQATARSDLEASLTSLINGIDTSSYVTLTTVNDLIATETQARGTAITDLRAEFTADLDSRATYQYVVEAVADEATARTSALNALSASIGTTYATQQWVTSAVADEESARTTQYNALEASLNGQVSALAQDVTLVEAEVDSLLASRLIGVSAGGAAIGVQFSAFEDPQGAASEARFYGQLFGFGLDINTPRLFIDNVAGALYALNAAGNVRTFEVEFSTGRVIHRASNGVVHYDSANGGTQTAGLAPGAVSNTDFREFGVTALPGSGAWATVASFTYAAQGGSIRFDTQLRISHTTAVEAGIEAEILVNGSKLGQSFFAKPEPLFMAELSNFVRRTSGHTGNVSVQVRVRANNTQGGVSGMSVTYCPIDIVETKR